MALERCARCLQPTPANVRRCPNCGEILKADFRRMSLYVAILLTIGVLAVVVLSLFLKPTIVDTENLPPSERQKTTTPAPPSKKPPLN